MTKLCPRGKRAAQRKFKVYPSAYANAYASRICAGKIKDPSGVKRKDFRGPKKAEGGRIGLSSGTQPAVIPGIVIKRFVQSMPKQIEKAKQRIRDDKMKPITKRAERRPELIPRKQKRLGKGKAALPTPRDQRRTELKPRKNKAGGGLMEATARLKRQGLRRGGGVCLRGMNKDAIGKNS